MKQGDTVDITTAHVIFEKICGPYTFDARPVIWPFTKAEDALSDWIEKHKPVPLGSNPSIPLCHRKLLHLICLDDEIKCLLSVPYPGCTKIATYGLYIYDIYAPYDYKEGIEFGINAHFVIISPEDKKSMRWSRNRKLVEAGEINAYKGLKEFQGAPEHEIRLFQLAHVLEYYAFDSRTVIKRRPTFAQALVKQGPPEIQRKEWPAIQIVALRRSESRQALGHHDPTGRKIGIRYPVTEHLRRQPTKQGVKVITIAEHWRGPKDGPVKPKVEKIYKVTR